MTTPPGGTPSRPVRTELDLDLLRGTDIYLIDQLLRERIPPGSRVLDAGCGGGRNLRYLTARGDAIWAVDESAEAVAGTERLLSATGGEGRVRRESVEAMSFEDDAFDLVISNAVLHFARDHGHFDTMVDEMWRVLAPGGLLFARLASTIGIAEEVEPLGAGWFAQPDGSNRYLVDEAQLLETTARLSAELADPLKTTLVHGLRSMTTWVVRKSGGSRR